MAAALELGGEEGLHDGLRQIGAHDARPQGQHVGVVVAAGHLRHERVGTQGAAHAVNLVGGDGNADAGGADDDATLTLAGGHRLRRSLGKDGIVAALCGVAAEIPVVQAVSVQVFDDVLLQGVSAVVRTQCDHSDTSRLK